MLVHHTNIMKTMSIHEAKAKLSGLVAEVEANGGRIVLSRYGKPVAEITPYRKRRRTQIRKDLAKIRTSGDLTQPTTEEWEDA